MPIGCLWFIGQTNIMGMVDWQIILLSSEVSGELFRDNYFGDRRVLEGWI